MLWVVLVGIAVLSPSQAKADCGCCKKVLGAKICEPVCLAACSVSKGDPVQVQLVPGTEPISIEIDKEVAVAVVTGGMVNPASRLATDAAVKEVAGLIDNTGNELEELGRDIGDESRRAERQVSTAVEAIGEYVEEKTKKTLDVPGETLDRVREGKIVDAVWRAATADLAIENDAASKAALKSELLRTAGQVAATVYGGPSGAAAYSAWLTYNQTGGDIDMALKVGVITGITAYAMAGASEIQTTDASGIFLPTEAAKKVAVTGAIGGVAVAAAGGDEQAVKDAFLRAGAMVLIQEGYREYTTNSLDSNALKPSDGSPYCISSVVDCQAPPPDAAVYDESGKFIGWDQTKLDVSAPRVGLGLPIEPIESAGILSEASPFMRGVSKVPGANAMAVLHDKWAMDWNMPPGVLQTTIYPAIVITYNGTSAPLFEQIREVAVGESLSSEDLAGATTVVRVAFDGVPKDVPVQESRVESSYLCAKDGFSKSITVEVDPEAKDFACRVLYRSAGAREVLWLFPVASNSCSIKAASLADLHLEWGYKCAVANATTMLSASAP